MIMMDDGNELPRLISTVWIIHCFIFWLNLLSLDLDFEYNKTTMPINNKSVHCYYMLLLTKALKDFIYKFLTKRRILRIIDINHTLVWYEKLSCELDFKCNLPYYKLLSYLGTHRMICKLIWYSTYEVIQNLKIRKKYSNIYQTIIAQYTKMSQEA